MRTITAARLARVNSGLHSVKELSARTGVPVGELFGFERGTSVLSRERLSAVCAALGVEARDITDERGLSPIL
jgi:transcriptional regulator with XRE-family HTH domain